MNQEYVRAIEERAYLRAQMDALREQALHNPTLEELIRLKTWARIRPGSVSVAGDDVVAPNGWPEGIDPDVAIEEAVDFWFPPAANRTD